MKLVRFVHAACAIIAGLAFALALFGIVRLAIAAIAIVLMLVAWSLEFIRTAIQTLETRR